MNDNTFSYQIPRRSQTGVLSATRVLALGDVSHWNQTYEHAEPANTTSFPQLDQLTALAFAKVNPELVLSPVVSSCFDCLDVAHALVSLRYQGRYRAIARDLPNVGLIRREVMAECPDLDFDVLDMSRLDAHGA